MIQSNDKVLTGLYHTAKSVDTNEGSIPITQVQILRWKFLSVYIGIRHALLLRTRALMNQFALSTISIDCLKLKYMVLEFLTGKRTDASLSHDVAVIQWIT